MWDVATDYDPIVPLYLGIEQYLFCSIHPFLRSLILVTDFALSIDHFLLIVITPLYIGQCSHDNLCPCSSLVGCKQRRDRPRAAIMLLTKSAPVWMRHTASVYKEGYQSWTWYGTEDKFD